MNNTEYFMATVKIAQMIHKDRGFAKQFKHNARAQLQKMGIIIPDKTELLVVEDKGTFIHFVLITPDNLNHELVGEVLTKITAAGSVKSRATLGSAATASSLSSVGTAYGCCLSSFGTALCFSTAGTLAGEP